MRSAKSDSNNDVKLVRDKLIINGTTFTHKVILKESGAKESGREPKNDRPHRPPVASNIGWGMGRAARPVFPKDSGAIAKLNFVSQNMYTPLRDLGDDISTGRGKKKATSPLEEQTSPKKLRDLPSPKIPDNDGTSTDDIEKENNTTTSQVDEPIHNTSTHQETTSDPFIVNGLSSGDNNSASG